MFHSNRERRGLPANAFGVGVVRLLCGAALRGQVLRVSEQRLREQSVNDMQVESDPLSGILERLRTVPWSAGVSSFDQHGTVSRPGGQVSFYVAARGDFFLSLGDNQPAARISQGTYVLLPHGVPHVLAAQAGSGARAYLERDFSPPRESGANGNGSAGGTFIYGHFPAASLGNNCFDAVFPPLATLDGASTPLLARCAVGRTFDDRIARR